MALSLHQAALAFVGAYKRIHERGFRAMLPRLWIFGRQPKHTEISDLHALLGKGRRLLTGRSGSAGHGSGWPLALKELVHELHELDLLNHMERDALLAGKRCVPTNAEARRRLLFFAQSLADPNLQRHDPRQRSATCPHPTPCPCNTRSEPRSHPPPS